MSRLGEEEEKGRERGSDLWTKNCRPFIDLPRTRIQHQSICPYTGHRICMDRPCVQVWKMLTYICLDDTRCTQGGLARYECMDNDAISCQTRLCEKELKKSTCVDDHHIVSPTIYVSNVNESGKGLIDEGPCPINGSRPHDSDIFQGIDKGVYFSASPIHKIGGSVLMPRQDSEKKSFVKKSPPTLAELERAMELTRRHNDGPGYYLGITMDPALGFFAPSAVTPHDGFWMQPSSDGRSGYLLPGYVASC